MDTNQAAPDIRLTLERVLLAVMGLSCSLLVAVQNHFPEALVDQPQVIRGLLPPTLLIERAFTHLNGSEFEQGMDAAAAAIQHAPFSAPAWAVQGMLAHSFVGPEAGLPYYSHAVQLDRFGAWSLRVALPPLHAANWISDMQLAWWALRQDSRYFASLLPAAPPENWPQGFADIDLLSRNSVLYAAGKTGWLAPLATAPWLEQLTSEAVANVVAAACQLNHRRCLDLVASCEAKSIACPAGLPISASLIVEVSQAALAVSDISAAQHWAGLALEHHPTPALIRNYADILVKTGQSEKARKLLRLHPALQK